MRMKGYFHVEVVDVNTGEVVREFENDNNLVHWGFDRIALYRAWGIDYGGYSPWDRQFTIWLSPDQYDPRSRIMNIRTASEFNPGDTADATDFVTAAIGNPLRQEFIPASGPVPAAYQVFGQFNPPPIGTTRTINTIACGGGSNEIHAFTDISAAPCIQTDSQQLNVTYRTQFFDDPVPVVSDVWRNPNATEWFARWNCDTGSDGAPLPSEVTLGDRGNAEYFGKTFLPHIADSSYFDLGRKANNTSHAQGYNSNNSPSQYAGFPGIPNNVRDNRTAGNTNKHVWDFDWTTSEGIGRIYGTVVLGRFDHQMIQTPFVPTTFPNQPIQVIHNHSSGATQPFLDTNFLATGQGSITMDGSGWTSTTRHPMMLRMDINNTGDVGVSTYTYRWKWMTGGMQAEDGTAPGLEKWRGVSEPYSWLSEFNDTFWPGAQFHWGTVLGSSTIDNANSVNCWEEWSDPEYAVVFIQEPSTWSTTVGVALHNMFTGANVYFDSTTTPALPTTKIHQVAVSDNGTIWVADADTGLYRITDPLGSPVITKMTVATHGIPVGTEQCYAVHQGNADSIWAVFDGGLSKSTDGGASWTNHDPGSVPLFDYSLNGGITNANWSNVRFMAIDRETPDNEMCIQYVGPTTTTQRAAHAWWSEAGVSYQGPDGNSIRNNDTRNMLKTDGGLPRQQLQCSRRGGFFVGTATPSAGSNGCFRYDFGHSQPEWIDAAYSNVNGNNDGFWGTTGKPVFHYDQYGIPYTWSGTNGGGYSSSIGGLYHSYEHPKIGNMNSSASNVPVHAVEQFGTPAEPHLYSGFLIAVDPSTKQVSDIYNWQDLWSISHGGPLGQNETRTDDSHIQDFLWHDVRWNGAAWVDDYHTDAVDSTANAYDGTRRGFKVEDLEFTGRSTIQIPTAAGTNFGGGDLTFVATVSPVAMPDSTDENANQKTLLSWSNDLPGSARNEFNFFWDRFYKTDAINPVTPTPELGAGTYTKGPAGAPNDASATTGGFAATPADGGTFRVVFTMSGGTLTIYVDGVQQGGAIAIPGMSTSSANMQKILIGARAGQVSHFFRGVLENIQLWNFPWSAGDAVTDSGNPTGVNIPGGGAIGNLIVHYQNNVSIAGMESKATHVGQEALKDGITIAFADGTSSPAFVDTDWYNVGVCDGIFKDNATSFDYHHELYTTPVVYDFPDIEDTVNAPAAAATSAVIPASGGQITEHVVWRQFNPASGVYIFMNHGELQSITGGSDTTLTSFQQLSGNGYIEWTMPQSRTADVFSVGLTEVPDNDNNNPGFTYHLRFRQSGTGALDRAFEIMTENTINVAAAGPDQWGYGDVFRIEKTGSTVEVRRNGGLIHTFARASVSPMWGHVNLNDNTGNHIIDVNINYTRPAGWLDLGNSLAIPTPTGKYDPEHLNIDDIGINGTIDATPFAAIKTDTALRIEEIGASPQAPGVGEVLVIPDAGMALFNATDFGKTATLTYIHVTYE